MRQGGRVAGPPLHRRVAVPCRTVATRALPADRGLLRAVLGGVRAVLLALPAEERRGWLLTAVRGIADSSGEPGEAVALPLVSPSGMTWP